MDKGLIILILNIVFALFIVVGFLIGLKGLKKSGLKFICFIVAVVFAIFLTPVISKSIMQIKITYNGSLMSLNDIILSYLNSSPQIAEVTNASPTMQVLIQNIPLMVGNVFIFVILTYVFAFLSWIVYLVLASVFIKKDEKIKDEKGNVIKVKTKKYRILGGLIGALQGLIFVFITFLPFSGLIGMVNDLTMSTAEAQEQIQNSNISPSAQFIKDYIPVEIQNIFDAYGSSAIAKMSGFLNFDDVCFNNVSTITVENIKISLRTEVINIAKVYDNVEFLFNVDFSSLETLKVLDYNKLDNAINYIFNSNILKATMPELVDYGFDKILDLQDIKNNQDLTELLKSIQSEIKSNDDVMNNLKTELSSIVGSCKILVESKLFDEMPLGGKTFTNENLKNILNILTNDNKKVFNNLIEQLFNSKALNKGVIYVLNIGVDKVEETLKEMTSDETLNIGRIDINDNKITLKKAEVQNLLSNAINLMKDFVDVDFNAIKNDYRLLFDMNLSNIVTNIGSAMNVVQKMAVFNDTEIYDNIMTALTSTEYQKYIDFEILKNDNTWLNESKILSEVLEKIDKSKIISYIDKVGDKYEVTNENITKILRNLTQKTEVNGQNKTLIRQIIEPLYNSNACKKIIDFGFEKLNIIINDLGSKIDGSTKFGDINYEYLHSESEKENIFSFIDNIALYVQNLNIDDLYKNPFKTILNSNLVQLGSCMDFVKNSLLFADKQVNGKNVEGIYTNFVDALINTEFSQYVNFACFKESTFSFNNEFEKITPIVDELLNKQIIVDNQSFALIEYIIQIGDEQDGWKTIFEQINSTDLTNIFEPLMKSKIFEPISVMVVNKINEQIKQVVGPYGDVITSIISSLDSDEISQVVDVLGAVSEIITDITAPDFNLQDMATGENAENLANLLNKLQDNANSDGVFKQSYDAMLEFVENDENIGTYVTDLIDDYPQGQIDWLDLLSKLPKNEG